MFCWRSAHFTLDNFYYNEALSSSSALAASGSLAEKALRTAMAALELGTALIAACTLDTGLTPQLLSESATHFLAARVPVPQHLPLELDTEQLVPSGHLPAVV